MRPRVLVAAACAPRCPSCVTCQPVGGTSLEDVLRRDESPQLTLGGGDALTWPHLSAFLEANRKRSSPQAVWVEAPARALTRNALERLVQEGAHGIVVLIEAVGEKLIRAMGVADGEDVIARAEALGLRTEARIAVRPKTLPMVPALARRLSPRPVLLEIARQDWGAEPMPLWPEPIEKLLLACPNVSFAGDRDFARGYLPPCVMPRAWAVRAELWRSTFGRSEQPNRVLDACASCRISDVCRWNDPGALDDEARASLAPIQGVVPWQDRRKQEPVPATTRARQPASEIVCITPWTTMDVHVSGRVHQCCADWTVGDRGDLAQASLHDIWNGEGYRSARRLMAQGPIDHLCRDICPRLYDQQFAESRLRIAPGSEPFVRNQLLLAEELAERRDVLTARPLEISVCPSTYCNYDCVMCVLGRTPREDLDARIWEELPAFLPTLKTLTLLGGEPLANPYVMRFLREFDREAWPDVRVDLVTNGSLLTAKALTHMRHCAFGDVIFSLNAGTPDVYAGLMRHGDLQQVLDNLDALIQWRARQRRWFGISASLVVQPANKDDLVEFGRRALERNLRIRLIPLMPHGPDGLDYYSDPDEVARVLEGLSRLEQFAAGVRPDWLPEITASRDAILEESRKRMRGDPRALTQLGLPRG